jgi:flagellin-like protein
MWIPVRFSDISKRPERRGVSGLFAVLFFFAFTIAGGCVVTDKIEFEDAVNHSISIERNLPEESIVTVGRGANQEFSALVWDMDVIDPERNPIEGHLEIRAEYWTESAFKSCDEPGLSDASVGDTEAGETPIFLIKCTVDIGDFEVIEDSLIELRLIVSDLGFYQNEAREGATTAETVWVLRVRQDSK